MVATAVTAATAVYGAYNASQNAKQQSSAMAQQQNAADAQLQNDLAFRQQQQQLYGPLEQQMVQQASGTTPLDYGLMSGQIQQSYDAAQRGLQQQMAARGLSASGLSGGGALGLEMGRANALSSAFLQGLQNRRALGMSVLSRYNPGANQQMVNQGYGNLQNMYGQYASMYGQAAQQGYGAAASGLGSLAQMYSMRQQQPQADLTGSIQQQAAVPSAPLPTDMNSGQQFPEFQAPMQPSLMPKGGAQQPMAQTANPFSMPGYFQGAGIGGAVTQDTLAQGSSGSGSPTQ